MQLPNNSEVALVFLDLSKELQGIYKSYCQSHQS